MKNRLPLLLVFLLALSLRLINLGQDGFSNLYYAATVQSMMTGAHNFFFAAFDPSGFVSVDKPPLGFWIQAISATVFGFQGWALVLPQALAGAFSTLVLYHLVQRVFGRQAGWIAALILAVTPISVAADRSNTPDGQLILVLLLAAWAASKYAESGQLRWLLLSAALVGVGFNIKMLEAYLVVPAFFLFLPVPHPLIKRFVQLMLAMLVLFTVSFAWVIAVEQTRMDQRPYIGSTQMNHVWELIVVHNGVRRLGPIMAWFGIVEKDNAPASISTPSAASVEPAAPLAWPDGGLNEVGEPGALRLLNPQMAGQVSWLLPLAVLALLTCAPRYSWKEQPLSRESLSIILWAGWLIPVAFVFSYGGLIHRYYLNMLAPPMAALCAIGLSAWMDDFRAGRRPAWLLPLAVTLTTAQAVFFLGYYPEAASLAPLLLAIGLLTVLALSFLISSHRNIEAIFAPIIISLLLAPWMWAITPLRFGGDVILPYAGFDLAYWGGARDGLSRYEPLSRFLVENAGAEKFIIVTDTAVRAAPLQLITKRPVMAMGGFTGTDPILTQAEFMQVFATGAARFVLVTHEELPRSERSQWLAENCLLVSPSPALPDEALYDCIIPR